MFLKIFRFYYFWNNPNFSYFAIILKCHMSTSDATNLAIECLKMYYTLYNEFEYAGNKTKLYSNQFALSYNQINWINYILKQFEISIQRHHMALALIFSKLLLALYAVLLWHKFSMSNNAIFCLLAKEIEENALVSFIMERR